ncbi:MAG: hypothetical protein HN919_00585 [Verrucomicrobia bacterium]|nr:hypothetical protein [Verrucomicrobiota bacterium]MBT7064774.1 hypothetical protein [Verrucomicrobiota bacterium]MBT7700040.1 hypothetical protein [Verrucomicrobiota bacterium]
MAAKAKRRRVKFQVEADAQSTVSVAGTFNQWDATRHVLKMKDGVYALNILLAPGQYQYKFVVNNVWCVDPECPEWAPNEYGSLNSVIDVA